MNLCKDPLLLNLFKQINKNGGGGVKATGHPFFWFNSRSVLTFNYLPEVNFADIKIE